MVLKAEVLDGVELIGRNALRAAQDVMKAVESSDLAGARRAAHETEVGMLRVLVRAHLSAGETGQALDICRDNEGRGHDEVVLELIADCGVTAVAKNDIDSISRAIELGEASPATFARILDAYLSLDPDVAVNAKIKLARALLGEHYRLDEAIAVLISAYEHGVWGRQVNANLAEALNQHWVAVKPAQMYEAQKALWENADFVNRDNVAKMIFRWADGLLESDDPNKAVLPIRLLADPPVNLRLPGEMRNDAARSWVGAFVGNLLRRRKSKDVVTLMRAAVKQDRHLAVIVEETALIFLSENGKRWYNRLRIPTQIRNRAATALIEDSCAHLGEHAHRAAFAR